MYAGIQEEHRKKIKLFMDTRGLLVYEINLKHFLLLLHLILSIQKCLPQGTTDYSIKSLHFFSYHSKQLEIWNFLSMWSRSERLTELEKSRLHIGSKWTISVSTFTTPHQYPSPIKSRNQNMVSCKVRIRSRG